VLHGLLATKPGLLATKPGLLAVRPGLLAKTGLPWIETAQKLLLCWELGQFAMKLLGN
jgi:hypothetical protein